MTSERMYTEKEVKEILQIHDNYRAWAQEPPFQPSFITGLGYHNAKLLIEGMKKYPTIFERELQNLRKITEDLKKASLT